MFRSSRDMRVIDVADTIEPSAEATATLQDVGVDYDTLKSFFHTQVEQGRSKLPCQPYMYDLCKTGSLSIPSFLTGETISASGSFFYILEERGGARLFYHFCDRKPYVLVPGVFSGFFVGVYFFEDNVYVNWSSVYSRKNSLDDLNVLRALIATYPEKVARYLSGSPKPPAVIFASLNHIGHTALQEYEPFHFLAEQGAFATMDTMFVGPSGFFEAERLFPELAGLDAVGFETMHEAFLCSIESERLAFRPALGDFSFSAALAARFQTMLSAPDVVDAARQVKPIPGAPTVWFEVRTNDRFWTNQVEGVAAIANRLAETYPGLQIVTAGWSKPLAGQVKDYDLKMIEQDRQVAEDIKSLLDDGIAFTDVTGWSPTEKAAAAISIDLYVAVYSSGIIFTSCIAQKPGVIFGSNYYLRSKERMQYFDGRWAYCDFPANVQFVSSGKVEDIKVGQVKSYWNFEVDWTDVYDSIVLALNAKRVEAAALTEA
ncbi:hypothetical protein [Chenggangzhangella methanolivorans]|uniref:Uncharacterized protein n=1 Tax=Chenggangzhangella methanolivorans TaxID=1437009 RepID=A0A9E6RAH0_9HYPH|nr:hypothetical protein [Chenggangzhangella methanolivorans]QZO01169.1 hypothetical protein K6K41_06375 [Chenggangzhangella methanolivorans]